MRIAAIAAAQAVGVEPARAIKSLSGFKSVRRAWSLRGTVAGVAVWDDFAHHPTAIATTIFRPANRVGSARMLGRPRATIQHHEGRPDEDACPPVSSRRTGFFCL